MWRGREGRESVKYAEEGEEGDGWTSQTSSHSDLTFFLVLVECRATDMLTSPFGNSCVSPFSKIFFPYLSDPSGEINLSALTPASSKSGAKAAALRHTLNACTLAHVHGCCPGADVRRRSLKQASSPPVLQRVDGTSQRCAVRQFKATSASICAHKAKINKQPIV